MIGEAGLIFLGSFLVLVRIVFLIFLGGFSVSGLLILFLISSGLFLSGDVFFTFCLWLMVMAKGLRLDRSISFFFIHSASVLKRRPCSTTAIPAAKSKRLTGVDPPLPGERFVLVLTY